MNGPRKIHRKLERAIDWIVENKEQFVENPMTNFTRNRKLPMADLIKTLLSMEGGSLNKELYGISLHSDTKITPSAFVQQRSKLRAEAVKTLIDQFNERCNDRRTFRGYRIFIQTGSKKGKINSPKTCISHWDFPSPYRFELRVVRVRLDDGKIETLITSLPRHKFSIEDIKQLYHMRWGIETSFRELKYTIGLSSMHSKKEKFAYQEIYAAIVMYNFCERIASFAIIKMKDGRHHVYQLNYSMAVTICKGYFKRKQSFISIIEEMERYILPVRTGRRANRKMRPHGFVSLLYRVSA